ncbi:hypothetical protein HT031_006735 [Scenedesmus sp. PABB004]|nr:hypothetical protein HT031_006735 [Scenedesmus sp. PABB004]
MAGSPPPQGEGAGGAADACEDEDGPLLIACERRVTWSEDTLVHQLPSQLSESNLSDEPGCWARFNARVSALKHDVLALYYAVHDARTPLLSKVLPWLVLAYALSPLDLIPDFIPVLGLLDDMLLLPLGLWVSYKLIPAQVMVDCRERARSEPLLLERSWSVAVLVFLAWTAALLAGVHWALQRWGDDRVLSLEWAVLAGAAGVAAIAFALWLVSRLRFEARRRDEWSLLANAHPPAMELETAGTVDDLMEVLGLGLVPAADGEQEGGPSSFEDLLTAAMGWEPAEADGNAAIMFPGWGGAHGAELPAPPGAPATAAAAPRGPPPGAAAPPPPARAAVAAAASPFAGIDISSVGGMAPPPPRDAEGSLEAQRQMIEQAQAQLQEQQAALALARAQVLAAQQAAAAGAAPPELAPPELAPPADAGSDGDAPAPVVRRGRPTKVPGQYSKGYAAIKRYRQRRKSRMTAMEAEVSAKLALLEALTAERDALLAKQAALTSTMDMQGALMEELQALRLSVGPDESLSIGAANDKVAALLVSQAGQAGPAGAALDRQAAAAVAAEVRRAHTVDVAQLVSRYGRYVQAASAALAAPPPAPGGPPAAPFPGFPFSMIESLALWKVSRAAGVPDGASGGAAPGALATPTVNLLTGGTTTATAAASLSGQALAEYAALADAVEWNLVRGRAMVVLHGWSMLCVLGAEQVGRICVAAWPHFPFVRAVVGFVLDEGGGA